MRVVTERAGQTFANLPRTTSLSARVTYHVIFPMGHTPLPADYRLTAHVLPLLDKFDFWG